MSDRARYLGFAACLGVALALIVYRFVVMGMFWDGPAKHVVEIGAMALSIVGWQLRRPIAKRQYPVLLVLGTGAVAFGVAFGICFVAIPSVGDAPLTMRELPGFSIGLPQGKPRPENLTYGTGAVQLDSVMGTGDGVRVGWEPGRLFDDSDIEMLAKGIGSMHSTKPEHGTGPHGQPTIAITIDTVSTTIHTIVTTCGGRRIMIMSESKELAKRILATLACHPDASKEGAVDTVPWTTTLPAGWFAPPAMKGQLWLTDRNNVLMARTIDKLPDRADMPALMQRIMNAAGVDMHVGDWSGDRYPVQATLDGKPYVGWVMPVQCTARAVLLMGFATDEAAADQIAAIAAKGRCLADGETPPPWPTKP